MQKKYLYGLLLSLLCLLTPAFVYAQSATADSVKTDRLEKLDFYLLTCSPGDQLYSLFGHTALRMHDNVGGQDVVFNYGTFDFSTSHFYYKFVRAILPYTLSCSSYSGFVASYRRDNRSVYSQKLNLSPEAKENLAKLLYENYLPQNRTYMYNFLFDNCSSRVRDIVLKAVGDGAVITDKAVPASLVGKFPVEGKSFWSMLDEYMEGYDWIHWGIHTILGYPATEKVDVNSAMFLPDYLMDGFSAVSYRNGEPLTEKTEIIYRSDYRSVPTPFYLSPLFVYSLVAVLVLLVYYVFNIRSRRFKLGMSIVFFVITGLVGLLIVFLGTCTYHPTVAPNFNAIWANPLNILVPFFLLGKRPKKNLRIYLYCSAVAVCLGVVIWYFLTPSVSMASIPLMLIMIMSHQVMISYLRDK